MRYNNSVEIFIDVALRKTGVLITDNFVPVEHFLVSFKDKLSLDTFEDIEAHYFYVSELLRDIKRNYSSINFSVLESDTFGARRGGYKTKEIMTIARMNWSHALNKITKIKPKNIIYVPSGTWKKSLLGNSSLKKDEYRRKILTIANELWGVNLSEIKNHDILDAYAIAAYWVKYVGKKKVLW